ncbi:MAG: hypothetical protein K2H01_11495 [Ruminococcus sp.]|nr:hypothetical protein [Ruminococcus sp.]
MKFNTAQQMLDYINSNHDLYSPKAEIYVFNYNEAGSIATYHITKDEARELSNKVKSGDEDYWAAFLGVGGSIWYDPSHECYQEGQMSNLDRCEELLEFEDWILTEHCLVPTEINTETDLYQFKGERAMRNKSFIADCLSGDATLSEIDDYVEYWHTHETGNSLQEFLGLTDFEYEQYVKSLDTILKDILRCRQKNISYEDYVRLSNAEKNSDYNAKVHAINEHSYDGMTIYCPNCNTQILIEFDTARCTKCGWSAFDSDLDELITK